MDREMLDCMVVLLDDDSEDARTIASYLFRRRGRGPQSSMAGGDGERCYVESAVDRKPD
jgi:hypothetical protein